MAEQEREGVDDVMLRVMAKHCMARGNTPPNWVLERLGLSEEDAYTKEQSHLVELHLSAGLRLDPKDR